MPGRVGALRCSGLQRRRGGGNHVVHLCTEHAANRLVKQAPALVRVRQVRKFGERLAPEIIKQGDVLQLRQGDQTGAHAIVNVVGVVGNFIGQIAQLCLQAGLAACQKPLPHATRLAHFQRLRIGA